MPTRIRVTVLLLLIAATTLAAQQITEPDVAMAIQAGQTKKFNNLISECVATAGFGELMAAGTVGGLQRVGSYTVVVSANAGRIAFLAANAKRLYKPFTAADVPDTLHLPGIFVSVEPNEPTRTTNAISVASPIDRVVLKSKVRPDIVVEPEAFDVEPVEWANLLGGKVEANRALAKFSFQAARELPAGDFDVVVVAQAGERRCKVGPKDRLKLFP